MQPLSPSPDTTDVAGPTSAELTPAALERELETYRRQLTGYCYRMLGSGFEADDAVQETMVRAWRNIGGFDGRSSLRSWLYRIATNVCLDHLRSRQRRALPMEMGPSSPATTPPGATLPENSWVQPVPDARVLPVDGDPAELAAARESIRLAFVAALQHLPPRQRAVLILCEVLRWKASEVAELLDTSTTSVNSALQRARATLSSRDLTAAGEDPTDPEIRALLDRYVDAFERYDMGALVALLHEDATLSMPPFALWLQGADQLIEWFVGHGSVCEGSRLVATAANGTAAFGSYHRAEGGGHEPFGLQVLEISGGRITGHHNFLGPDLFEAFGLPLRLER
ncbi:sigma-70 family RNA polymerase sigma factor [soil metagenome]